MATFKVRYLVAKRGGAGLPRYFWQPSSQLAAQGWRPRRVPVNWREFSDRQQLEAAAIAAAEALNAQLDGARTTSPARVAPAVMAPPAEPTIHALISAYRGSEAFTRLRPSTKRGYLQCLEKIGEWAGNAPVRAIDWQRIEKLKGGRLKATPSFRNAVLRVLRILLGRAVKLGWIQHNPAEKPGLQGIPASGLIWPPEAVAAFVATADRMGRWSVGTAVMLDEWIGQRQGDVLHMPRSVWRGDNLVIRQSKTGAGVMLPIGMVPQLVARLEGELARLDARFARATVKPAQLIVDEATGRAYNADRFRHVFAEIRAETAKTHPTFEVGYLLPGRAMEDPHAFTVKMTDLWFMHLRHTAITRLAEVDCDIPTIAAVSGHAAKSVEIIMGRYLVKTSKLARLAFQKRLDAEADVHFSPHERGRKNEHDREEKA